MQAEGVGEAALAERLDVALPQIDRLLDPRNQSRIDAPWSAPSTPSAVR
jgi:hypothetical protein